MSLLILGSSVTLAWIYGDETIQAIRRLFDPIADDGAVVPALWRFEVANSLTMAVRKRRSGFPSRRARRFYPHGLPTLSLPAEEPLPLATLDQELRAAATSLDITVLGSDLT